MLYEILERIVDIFKSRRKSDIELHDNDFDKITGTILEEKISKREKTTFLNRF